MRGGFALVRGIGDELERGENLALVGRRRHPAVRVARPRQVYRTWDELGGPRDDDNDLRAAAEDVEPRLVEFRRAVEAAAGVPALLAGSGSSYALVFEHAEEAARASDRIAAAVPGWVWLGATTPHGVYVHP